MFRGSLIDSEFQGISTIEIMNLLAPDVVTLGDFVEIFPFGGPLYSCKLTGAQLRRAVQFMLRDESFLDSDHDEWRKWSKTGNQRRLPRTLRTFCRSISRSTSCSSWTVSRVSLSTNDPCATGTLS